MTPDPIVRVVIPDGSAREIPARPIAEHRARHRIEMSKYDQECGTTSSSRETLCHTGLCT